jgi:hypothetical protein
MQNDKMFKCKALNFHLTIISGPQSYYGSLLPSVPPNFGSQPKSVKSIPLPERNQPGKQLTF